MRAITIEPGTPASVNLGEVPEPVGRPGLLHVETLAVGVCGTDQELIAGDYGWAPPGAKRLVLGHESLGRVIEAPADSGFSAGDLVVGIVRRPDPLPCSNCAVGEWDMCRNGKYTEHGIKEVDGFCAERWFIEPQYAVRLDPALGRTGVLLEPTTVVAKAWEQIDRIAARSHWSGHSVLVTGAGPVGMLAALLGVQRGYQVHVLDRMADGKKPTLVRALGATYHTGALTDLGFAPDVILECTGADTLVEQSLDCVAASGIVCLAGVSAGGHPIEIDLGKLNRDMVLSNKLVFGSVNANRRHYEQAAEALRRAERGWLDQLITRRVPLERWQEAYQRQPDDIKTVVEFIAH